MALYVSICLLAALIAVSHPTEEVEAFLIVWGTTLGLAIAHFFAFRVSARLVAAGKVRRHDADIAAAEFVGAIAVALLATIPMLLFPDAVEFDVVRLTLAGFICGRVRGCAGRRSKQTQIVALWCLDPDRGYRRRSSEEFSRRTLSREPEIRRRLPGATKALTFFAQVSGQRLFSAKNRAASTPDGGRGPVK